MTPGTLVGRIAAAVRRAHAIAAPRHGERDRDPLTGLPSARHFHEAVVDEHARAARSGGTYAVLLLDVDDFAEVNQAFGHVAGDAVLAEIGERLDALTQRDEVLGRWSGDQFVVLLRNGSRDAAVTLAQRILASFAEPFRTAGEAVELAASVGIAVHPEHARDVAALLGAADAALHAAKRTKGAYAVAATPRPGDPTRPLALRADLRRALDAHELRLAYQPVVDLRSGAVVRFEALARWTHPRYGEIPPLRFIELAERTGLIHPLTHWALGQAIADVAAWRAIRRDVQVSVNVSARAFTDTDLAGTIRALCRSAGTDGCALGVEITESVLMADRERARATVEQLRAIGVRIEIDDFGTGYSSLAYLQRLPVDGLKVDRQFIAAMASDMRSDHIVRAMIALGHELGFEVVAEGIEDEPTYGSLAAVGCDLGQGYLIARPLARDDVPAWLQRWIPPLAHREAADGHDDVLVVDDDDALVSVVSDVLRDNGYAVRTASSGQEALDQAKRGAPRLVLLDVHMPALDGPALASALRRVGITAPIVVMTAGPSARRWADELQADGFLAKPFELKELLAVARRFA